jgi:hypothetical protein
MSFLQVRFSLLVKRETHTPPTIRKSEEISLGLPSKTA